MIPCRTITVLLALCFAALGAGGCSSGREVTLPGWRASIEKYILEEANGDPNSLRDLERADGQKGFAVFGHPDPEYSTDAVGVLLGHKLVGQRHWFVFLVGLVVEEQVSDIRLAALCAEGNKFEWAVSPPDKPALRNYLRAKRDLWRQRFNTKRAPPPAYTTFAAEDDFFEVAIDGQTIIVTHPASGARWSTPTDARRKAATLALAPPPPAVRRNTSPLR